MKRFRQDNTEGYSDVDLAVMNEAFDCAVNRYMELVGKIDKSLLDHLAEEVQFTFDQQHKEPAL
jgi:hypothetical protein